MCYDEQNCDWDIAMATEEIDRLRDEVKRLEAIVAKYRKIEARILKDLELSDVPMAAAQAVKE